MQTTTCDLTRFCIQITEMDGEEVDEEQQEQLKNLWKVYGRESEMGKKLFAMYNKHEKPKIVYPKTRPKSEKELQAEKTRATVMKKCPQKTEIEYPEAPRPVGKTYHPIDFIPKRKAESVIRLEIEEYKRRRALDIPANRGVDRAALVRKLQQKFKSQGGSLPKGAELPVLAELNIDEKEVQQKARQRVEKKFNNYSKPVKNPHDKQASKKNVSDELDELFEQVVAEIDDRQKYLDSIEHLQQPELKAKIKREMIERIAELQKISELKNK